MDYLYIVNAFKQQQQQFLLHQHQLQQQLQNQQNSSAAAGNPLTLQQQQDNSNMANSLLWQPWRDLQHAAAVHHHLYRQQQQQQQQQQEQMEKEARLSSKELPTTAWRRERRLRTGEYHHPSTHHHHHHHSSPGSTASSMRASSPSSSPPPAAHTQLSPTAVNAVPSAQLHSNAHQISMMMAAAAAAGMRPLCESTNRPSPPPPSSHAVGTMHLGHIAHTQALHQIGGMETDDAPLDMSVSSSLKPRNSPPPPYREPLPGSQFASSLPRPSVITQAPPKRDIRDSALIANRENDNRSSESIDEHFRRSLGNDYFALFAKKSPASQSTKSPSPQPQQQPPVAHARTPPPPVAPTVTATDLPLPTSNQTAIVPPPAYPNTSLPPLHHQQSQALISPKPNTMLLSPAAMAAQIKGTAPVIEPNSPPPLPLVVRPPVQQHQPMAAFQRSLSVTASTPLPSPQSPTMKTAPIQSPISSTAGSRTASPLPSSNPQAATMTLSRFTSVENSPSSSPRHTPPVNNVAVPNASPTLPAILRIKTEPGLQCIKAHNPTPPASPTSTTNPNIMMGGGSSHTGSPSSPSPSSPSAASCSSTATIKTNSTSAGGNSSAEVLASVDDHFAKALGDTWKRLQESKEMRK